MLLKKLSSSAKLTKGHTFMNILGGTNVNTFLLLFAFFLILFVPFSASGTNDASLIPFNTTTKDRGIDVDVDLEANTKTPREKLIEKIRTSAVAHGVDPDTAVRISVCESSLNGYATNPHSSATGLYQFTLPTWKYIGAKGTPYNIEESIEQFMVWYQKYPAWWQCI